MSVLKFFWTAIFCSLFIASCQKSTSDVSNSGPNILLILADDMGYGDVSNSGNKYLKTPHLDELATKSVNFKNFYVSPVCAPTRASLLTGQYHQEVGVRSVTNGFEIMDPNAVTLAEILKEEGYRTAIFGKWHLGEYYPSVPNAQGFDEYLGFRTGHTSNYFDPVLEHNGKPEKTQGYITDVLTNKALDFINNSSSTPFFCYLAYNAPHTPLQIEESKFQKFLGMGLDDKTSRVYAMVENIDDNVGKILAELAIEGRLENTIVIFLSDNGPLSGWQIPQEKMRYNAGLRDQKFTTYEGGIRTQCYWMWNGQWLPYYDSTSIAAHIDIVPTLAQILNVELPDSLGVDGYDLSRTLKNQIPVDEKRIYFEDFHLDALRTPQLFNGGIARQAFWKMVAGTELYNLDEDPGEQINLAEKYPEKLAELNEAYTEYYKDVFANGHVLPLPIKVGFDEENPVRIAAHHGLASGNVQFMGFRGNYNESYGAHPTGVDGSWTSDWKQKGDGMKWELNFVEEAFYEIGISANGNIGENSCIFNVGINEEIHTTTLPVLKKSDDWKYIPLLKIKVYQKTDIKLQLQSIASSDSLNINKLVITKL